jgi:hypothetical protein
MLFLEPWVRQCDDAKSSLFSAFGWPLGRSPRWRSAAIWLVRPVQAQSDQLAGSVEQIDVELRHLVEYGVFVHPWPGLV